MVSPLRISLLLFLMLMIPTAWATSLDVKLDSAEIAVGDTVNLTVTVNEQAFGETPDFSALKKDFQILSNRQSSQFSMNNGQISSSTSWILSLLPKREGFIAIPPLRYGNQTSKPLKLHVTQQRKVDSPNSNEVIFLDAQVDKKEVYVQEQVIYTVRLYRRIDLHESTYSPPTADSAVLEQLGNQREYTSTLDGRSYKIIELRYAIFPQQSGELAIQPAQIVGTIFMGNSSNFMFDPFNGRQIRRSAPPISLHVKPQPANYPADKPWLPARSLKLREVWTPDSHQTKVGEPLTRQITLEAEGLAQTTLPPIQMPDQPDAKIYPEQPELASTIGPRGMVSTRKESFALIGSQAGELTLPAVEVTWWDVDEGKTKVASLPARKLTITGSARQLQTDAQLQAPDTLPQDDQAPASLNGEENNSTWQWIAGLALLLWLGTLAAAAVLFWRRRQPAPRADAPPPPRFNRQAEKAARTAFQDACTRGDAKAARQHLILSYRQIFQSEAIHNLDDVLARTPDPALADHLQTLEAQLYKHQDSRWNGTALFEATNVALDKQARTDATPASALAPLFPG